MANINHQLSPNIKLWARTIGFFADGSDAGFFLVATHKQDDSEHYCAFSERSGDCVCTSMFRNAKYDYAPYGREYIFSFVDDAERTIYLESID